MKQIRDNFAQLDATELAQYNPDYDYLVALSSWDIAVILSLTRYAHWLTRWRNVTDWDAISAQVTALERKLMANISVEDLIKTNLMLVGAITGQAVDLSADLPAGVVDFSAVGLSSRFAATGGNLAELTEAINTTLGQIKTAIEGQSNDTGLDDELTSIYGSLQTIAIALGATL